MIETRSIEEAYRAARQSLLAVRLGEATQLVLTGDTRHDLLNRMSTNELESLAPGQQRETVFTDPLGRMLELTTVLAEPEHTRLLCAYGRAGQLQDWLQRHIFFQDDVGFEPSAAHDSLWAIVGPQAGEVLQELDAALPTRSGFESFSGGLAWQTERPVHGYSLLISGAPAEENLKRWGGGPGELQAYEILRVEAGMPADGAEIQDDSIPLEVGLRHAISFAKGCYTGQEIIARLDSRNRLAKRLVGLRLSEPIAPGSDLLQGDRSVGSVTSVVESPDLGWIALASLRQTGEAAEPFTVGSGQAAELVELPFQQTEH